MQKLTSVEKISEKVSESREKIRKYIRLTYLIKELLDLVDNRLTKDPRYNLTTWMCEISLSRLHISPP